MKKKLDRDCQKSWQVGLPKPGTATPCLAPPSHTKFGAARANRESSPKIRPWDCHFSWQSELMIRSDCHRCESPRPGLARPPHHTTRAPRPRHTPCESLHRVELRAARKSMHRCSGQSALFRGRPVLFHNRSDCHRCESPQPGLARPPHHTRVRPVACTHRAKFCSTLSCP